jgi:hypothetical protein
MVAAQHFARDVGGDRIFTTQKRQQTIRDAVRTLVCQIANLRSQASQMRGAYRNGSRA